MGQEQSTVGGGGFAFPEDPTSLNINGRLLHQQTFVHSSSVQHSNINNQQAADDRAIAPPPLAPATLEEEEVIDIYDTGVSAGLRALLATLHEDNTEYYSHNPPTTLEETIHLVNNPSESLQQLQANYATAKLSPSAPEFVPSTTSRWLNAAAPEFVPVLPVRAAVTPAPISNSIPTSAQQLSEVKTWWYRDPKAVYRGPFSTSEMKAWFNLNFFPSDLMVARDEYGPYIPLDSLYGADVIAADSAVFGAYMDIREFNLKLHAYLLANSSSNSTQTP